MNFEKILNKVPNFSLSAKMKYFLVALTLSSLLAFDLPMARRVIKILFLYEQMLVHV
jgi:hypothetical protein